MHNQELLSRISVDPNIYFGKPCIKGHRIWVSLILDHMANGSKPAQILAEYPQLEEKDILACLAYRAESVNYHQKKSSKHANYPLGKSQTASQDGEF